MREDNTILGKFTGRHEWQQSSIEMEEDEWIGVLADGTLETFKKQHAHMWGMRVAQETLQSISSYGLLDRVEIIKSCSALAGADLKNVFSKIEKPESMSYQQAYLRSISNKK